jgi:hypothetical protein
MVRIKANYATFKTNISLAGLFMNPLHWNELYVVHVPIMSPQSVQFASTQLDLCTFENKILHYSFNAGIYFEKQL